MPIFFHAPYNMAYSDDSVYKECVKNSNSEIIFFAVSAFSAFILCIYHLFKCAFIKCDLKLVDSVGDQTEVSNQNLFNTKIGAVELKNLRKREMWDLKTQCSDTNCRFHVSCSGRI